MSETKTATKYKTYVVRPKISSTDRDPVGEALAKHGMSKFAGCPDIFYGPAVDRTLNRNLTGFDETHPDILILPEEKREQRQEEIISERESLGKAIGADLYHTSDWWDTLKIVLDRGKIFNTRNPEDRIILTVLKAGDMVPFGRDNIDDPKYNGVNYYIGDEFEDVAEKTQNRAKDRKVSTSLSQLLSKYDLAIEVGKYLGIDGVSHGIPLDNLDDLLSTFIEKKPANKDTFLEAVDQSEEFIRLSNLFKEFKVAKLVRYEDGRWMSGKTKLGRTEKEAVKNLVSTKPEMQAEKAKLLEDFADLKAPRH